MSRILTIKKGLDIKIAGGLVDNTIDDALISTSYAVIPDDFHGFNLN